VINEFLPDKETPTMIAVRRAGPDDLEYLIATDRIGEGYTLDTNEPPMTDEGLQAHRRKIAAFVEQPSEAAWVAEAADPRRYAGMILARFRDRFHEPPSEANLFLFRFLPPRNLSRRRLLLRNLQPVGRPGLPAAGSGDPPEAGSGSGDAPARDPHDLHPHRNEQPARDPVEP
jgi:hypothetical protein